MISTVGPESWFEQRPKVIVEDDERRPKVVVVEDDALLRRKVSADLRSEGFQVLEAATAHEAFLLFKSVPDVGVVMSDMRVIGVMKDGALVGMPVSEYLRHCGYRVLEAANSDEALLLSHNPDTQADVVMIDVGGSGAMSGFKLTQRVHTFLASWGLGDWLLGIGRVLRAEYMVVGRTGAAAPASRCARQEHSRSRSTAIPGGQAFDRILVFTILWEPEGGLTAKVTDRNGSEGIFFLRAERTA